MFYSRYVFFLQPVQIVLELLVPWVRFGKRQWMDAVCISVRVMALCLYSPSAMIAPSQSAHEQARSALAWLMTTAAAFKEFVVSYMHP